MADYHTGVLTGAWQHQNRGKIILLFANISDQKLSSPVQFDPKDYNLIGKSFKATSLSANESRGELSIPANGQTQVDLPPRSVLAWEVSSRMND